MEIDGKVIGKDNIKKALEYFAENMLEDKTKKLVEEYAKRLFNGQTEEEIMKEELLQCVLRDFAKDLLNNK